MADAFIKLYNKLLKWEWYDDINTKVVFLHCLLKANWDVTKWHGLEIQPGQFVTSLSNLAKETTLTVRQVRTALEHLESTGEVTSKGQSKYRIITVNNWTSYQGNDKQKGKQATNKRQTNDKQTTTVKDINRYILTDSFEEDKTLKNKRHIYGEYKHVRLTDKEFERLVNDYGHEKTCEAIKFLDEYKERKGYTSKNDNLTLRKWVFDAIERDQGKGPQSQPQSLAEKWGITDDD